MPEPKRTILPHQIMIQCKYCGLWYTGPFSGRRDVPVDEIHRFYEQFMSHPSYGYDTPAPYRPGGTVYQEGEDDSHSGGGPCEDCMPRFKAENLAKREGILRAIRAPKPEPVPEPVKPEPSEEQARAFLMGEHEGEPKKDEGTE